MNWPGNVRELENTVNRLAIFAPTGRITLADIEAESRRGSEEREPADPAPPTPDRLLEMERQHTPESAEANEGKPLGSSAQAWH